MSILSIIEKSKKTRQKKTRTKILAGLVVGAVVGAAAGILLAPRSGKKTRENIATATKQLPEKAKKFADLSKAKFEEAKNMLIANKQTAEAEIAASQEFEKVE